MTDRQTNTLHTLMLAYSTIETDKKEAQGADAVALRAVQMRIEQAIETYTNYFVKSYQ